MQRYMTMRIDRMKIPDLLEILHNVRADLICSRDRAETERSISAFLIDRNREIEGITKTMEVLEALVVVKSVL